MRGFCFTVKKERCFVKIELGFIPDVFVWVRRFESPINHNYHCITELVWGDRVLWDCVGVFVCKDLEDEGKSGDFLVAVKRGSLKFKVFEADFTGE